MKEFFLSKKYFEKFLDHRIGCLKIININLTNETLKSCFKMFTLYTFKRYIKNALIRKQTKQHGVNRSKIKVENCFLKAAIEHMKDLSHS